MQYVIQDSLWNAVVIDFIPDNASSVWANISCHNYTALVQEAAIILKSPTS
jgi:hypothetical protein